MLIQPKILILDSGVGGLSVARDIDKLLPHVHMICFADNAGYPYGSLLESELTHRLVRLCERLIPKHDPDLVVIACNTASTIALETLRSRFSLPFVGVVPAIKPAAKASLSGAIGVLATPATIERPYTHQLIEDFADGIEVYLHGSLKLVECAEQYIGGEKIELHSIKDEIFPLIEKSKGRIDTIVLACTHFPLLRKHLSKIEEFQHISWIDSGIAIAQRVHFLLEQLSLPTQAQPSRQLLIQFSSPKAVSDSSNNHYAAFIRENFLNKSLAEINVDIEQI